MNRIANFIKDAGRTAGETVRSTAISAAEKASGASDAIQLHRNSHEEAKYAKYAQSVEPIRAGLAGFAFLLPLNLPYYIPLLPSITSDCCRLDDYVSLQ